MQAKHFLLAAIVAASITVHDTPHANAQEWHNPTQGYSNYAYNNHGGYTRRLTRVIDYTIRPNSAQADLLQPGYFSDYIIYNGFGISSVGVYPGSGR